MSSKTRLDVGDGYPGGECRTGTAESARGVALNDDQFRSSAKQRKQGRRHPANVGMRVVLPRTAEIDPPELVQSELSRIELRMLPGQDDRRRDALRRKRMGDGL
jgi:hypothetical protein